MGDFNEIMFSYEKKEGRLRDERGMMAFQMTLEDCDMLDLRYQV